MGAKGLCSSLFSLPGPGHQPRHPHLGTREFPAPETQEIGWVHPEAMGDPTAPGPSFQHPSPPRPLTRVRMQACKAGSGMKGSHSGSVPGLDKVLFRGGGRTAQQAYHTFCGKGSVPPQSFTTRKFCLRGLTAVPSSASPLVLVPPSRLLRRDTAPQPLGGADSCSPRSAVPGLMCCWEENPLLLLWSPFAGKQVAGGLEVRGQRPEATEQARAVCLLSPQKT